MKFRQAGFANAKILILKQITTQSSHHYVSLSAGFANAKILILKQITTEFYELKQWVLLVLLMQRY